MESIIPILGVVFFLAFLANKLNKKEDETVNRQYDEVVAGMAQSSAAGNSDPRWDALRKLSDDDNITE